MGLLAASDVARIARVLGQAGLPVDAPALGEGRYLELMGHDKKVEDGQLRLVLLKSLGKAFVTSEFSLHDLRAVLAGATVHA
jgi:3-dehydroquinate synthase